LGSAANILGFTAVTAMLLIAVVPFLMVVDAYSVGLRRKLLECVLNELRSRGSLTATLVDYYFRSPTRYRPSNAWHQAFKGRPLPLVRDDRGKPSPELSTKALVLLRELRGFRENPDFALVDRAVEAVVGDRDEAAKMRECRPRLQDEAVSQARETLKNLADVDELIHHWRGVVNEPIRALTRQALGDAGRPAVKRLVAQAKDLTGTLRVLGLFAGGCLVVFLSGVDSEPNFVTYLLTAMVVGTCVGVAIPVLLLYAAVTEALTVGSRFVVRTVVRFGLIGWIVASSAWITFGAFEMRQAQTVAWVTLMLMMLLGAAFAAVATRRSGPK
jgi:hypothetical protein